MGAYFADLVLCFAEKDGYGRTKGVVVSVFEVRGETISGLPALPLRREEMVRRPLG